MKECTLLRAHGSGHESLNLLGILGTATSVPCYYYLIEKGGVVLSLPFFTITTVAPCTAEFNIYSCRMMLVLSADSRDIW